MAYITSQNCEQFIHKQVVCSNIITRSDSFDTTSYLVDMIIGCRWALSGAALQRLKQVSDVSM